jgi:hypothetical protein
MGEVFWKEVKARSVNPSGEVETKWEAGFLLAKRR